MKRSERHMTSDRQDGCAAPSPNLTTPPIAEVLERWGCAFDTRLAPFLDPIDDVPSKLVEAMRYTALAKGKRVRPYLSTRWCELNGGTEADALPAAVAVELIHAFSLIHDDLPAMDDDALRRGQPTSHKKFGEAMAILAGDALLALSFEIVAREVRDSQRANAILLELARATGWSGMIGGQAADVFGEGQPPSRALTEYIQRRKTASLFQAACRIGALAAGATPHAVEQAGRYGWNLGSAFQITDDLLDVTASREQLGKDVAKDARAGKQTMAAAVGPAECKTVADQAIARAVSVLDPLGSVADDLRALAVFVVERHH